MSPPPDAPRPRSLLRWFVLALLFASTVLNYVDRQTLSILASTIQRDLGIDDPGYARIVQAFLLAYTFAYLFAGWLSDRLGTRLSLALFVGWWSLADMATALVRGAAGLGFARLMLGLGEAGNYTAGPKAIADHFPPRERGFAYGVYTAGAMVGATLAPPMIAWLALRHGWRSAFVATGAAGLVWLVLWLLIYRDAQSAEETQRAAPAPKTPFPWRDLLTDRPFWGLALARLLADPVWYFYLFWFPKYLTDARGLTLIEVGSLAWLVYLAADVGSVGGGLFSDRLVRRGVSPVRARLIAIACACALAPVGMTIAAGPGIGVTLAIGAVVAFAHLCFQINMGALIVDLYPERRLATVFGLIAAGSGLGGFLSTQLVGRAAGQHDYPLLFLLMGALHPLAAIITWLSVGTQKGSRLREG